MQETQIWPLGQDDSQVRTIPLEEEMAAHSSILVWEISWTEEPGGLQSIVSQSRSDMTKALSTHAYS